MKREKENVKSGSVFLIDSAILLFIVIMFYLIFMTILSKVSPDTEFTLSTLLLLALMVFIVFNTLMIFKFGGTL